MTSMPDPHPPAAVVLNAIAVERVVAIIRGDGADLVGAAMVDAGVRIVEVTLTVDGAFRSIAELRRIAPTDAVVGAGTVLTVHDAERAVDAGAQFLVSPHLDLEIVAWSIDHDIAYLPGVLTPTEIIAARRAGARALKLFPAGSLGPGYLRDLLGPFPDLEIVPARGVDGSNARMFLDVGAIAVGLGSALTPAALRTDRAALTEHVRTSLALLQNPAAGDD